MLVYFPSGTPRIVTTQTPDQISNSLASQWFLMPVRKNRKLKQIVFHYDSPSFDAQTAVGDPNNLTIDESYNIALSTTESAIAVADKTRDAVNAVGDRYVCTIGVPTPAGSALNGRYARIPFIRNVGTYREVQWVGFFYDSDSSGVAEPTEIASDLYRFRVNILSTYNALANTIVSLGDEFYTVDLTDNTSYCTMTFTSNITGYVANEPEHNFNLGLKSVIQKGYNPFHAYTTGTDICTIENSEKGKLSDSFSTSPSVTGVITQTDSHAFMRSSIAGWATVEPSETNTYTVRNIDETYYVTVDKGMTPY